MPIKDWPGIMYDVLFREFPHRAETGLFRIGNPDDDAPVILTGNYTETVRRMRKILKNSDVWLLVANSKGINVWCAAGGGHFTHHDVISAVITSRAGETVASHKLILPQLGATGIERKKVEDATGFETHWGPAMLDDLPAFLKGGHNATPIQRYMRFPMKDRMEMATLWAIPMILIGFIVFSLLGGVPTGTGVGLSAALVSYGIFAVMPKVDLKKRTRWLPLSALTLAGILLSWIILFVLEAFTTRTSALSATGAVVETLVLSVDLAGTTPWYGSYINTFRNHAHIDLVDSKCNGSADCLLVCPRDVFRMDGVKKKIGLKSPEDCIECGACIVQCPQDALRFRYDDGRFAEAQTIRRTRMNMLGKRTVEIRGSGDK